MSAYFLSRTLADLPRTFVAIIVFCSILYPIVGFRWGGEYFLKFFVAVLLTTLTAESTAYLGESNRTMITNEEHGLLCLDFLSLTL